MRIKYYNEQHETTKSLERRGSLILGSSLKADGLEKKILSPNPKFCPRGHQGSSFDFNPSPLNAGENVKTILLTSTFRLFFLLS
jgi:hypothetical protein